MKTFLSAIRTLAGVLAGTSRKLITAGVVTLFVCSTLPFPVTAADGDLDPTFGSGGKVTTDLSGDDIAQAIAIQPDGKIVAAGSAGIYPFVDFGLVRYNTNGSLDSTFGSGGKVTTDFFGNPDGANAVALQPDGKIVAGGIAVSPGSFVFALARYNSDGSLDTTFGIGGKVATPFSTGEAEIFDIAIQADNKIVAVGVTFRPMADFALARYNSDGSLDSGFGAGGLVVGNFFTNDIAFAVALQSDAKIVVAGVTNLSSVPQNFTLARYNTNGGLDTTFGPGGKIVTDFFNTFDSAFDVVIQPDGKIVAAGYSTMNTSDLDFALARYDASGSLDPGFGSGGKVITSLGSGRDVVYGLALQPDGKIVVVGESGGGTSADFAAARYNGDGSLDPSFGSMGKVTTDFSGGVDRAYDLALQSDGKIVAGGFAHNSASGDDFALVRYGTSFDLCLQDDTNPNSIFRFDTTTGNYQVCCAGTGFTGTGVVTKRGSTFTLQDNTNGRRILAKFDESAHQGSASIQVSGRPFCSIRDTNTTNNACACQ